MSDRTFEYLLNAFEQASQADCPEDHDYAGKRVALFAYVSRLLSCVESAEKDAERDEWRAMLYAPQDGTEIELLIHHTNRRYAKPDERPQWEQVVRAKWINHNGGGWTWHGMAGWCQGWRAAREEKR